MFVKQFGWLARRWSCLAGPIGSVIEVDVSSWGLANPRARFRRRLPHALTRGQIVWVLYGQASRAISIG